MQGVSRRIFKNGKNQCQMKFDCQVVYHLETDKKYASNTMMIVDVNLIFFLVMDIASEELYT